MKSVRAIIALGGNEGDVMASFRYALKRLGSIGTVDRTSHIYQTTPVGGPVGQPDFLNAVLTIQTELEPRELLSFMLSIESERGRLRFEKWGPRTLDLDLLDYDGEVLKRAHLQVPHPRMWGRGFVLVPLRDVAPDYIHPANHEPLKDRLKAFALDGVTKTEANW